MAKRVYALVDPALLVWARDSAGYSIEDIASKIQKNPEVIVAWEKGEYRPFLGQLRRLADICKRPLSDFYLPVPPEEQPIPHDFRRSPGEIAHTYSPALRRQLRFARERQELAVELFYEIGENPPAFGHKANLDSDPEDVGEHIRRILGIDSKGQASWGDGRSAYKAWRTRIEALGILVFQFEQVSPDEAWGFSLAERKLPVIGVNIDLAPNGRTFTMLHEFVHLLLGASSICDIDDLSPRGRSELRMEVFCNQAAAAAFMPRDSFLSHTTILAHLQREMAWGDNEIETIAKTFGVSREAVVRRLLTFRRTTRKFYQRKRAQFRAEREAHKSRQREESKNKKFKRNMAQRSLSNLGQNFVGVVLNSYHENRITLLDAANYLGVRAQGVRKVQDLALGA